MRQTLYILCLLLTFIPSVFAQKQKESKADKYYDLYSFDKAIKAFNKEQYLNVTDLRKLAMSYYNRGEFMEAEKVFEKFVENDSCQKNDLYYYILTLKSNQKYSKANKSLAIFKSKYPQDLRACSYKDSVSSLNKLLILDPNCTIFNLEVNSEDDDFGTAYFNKQVVFASSRKEVAPIGRKYNWNRRPFLNMYVADKMKDNELENPILWNRGWNQKWHEGPASFSADGTIVAFTRNNYAEGSADDVVRLQIFFSELEYGAWSEITPFKLNSVDYSVGHPCLNKKATKMYFSSDKPGGFGGSDIYCIEKKVSGEWGEAVNLGPAINTEANDMFPFFDESTMMLYFASNGHSGIGGLDIFSARLVEGKFMFLQNLGSPINTSADDFAFVCESGAYDGYLSSNRKAGKGGDDIYSFHYKSKPPTLPTPREYRYRLFVKNAATGERIYDAEVNMGGKIVRTNLRGEVSLMFTDTSSFLNQAQAFGYKDTKKIAHLTIPKNGYEVRDTISLNMEDDNKVIVLREIYYDFDKWNILPESQKELNRVVQFLKDNKDKMVELQSHTDSRGSDKYNLWLSQERAQSAVNYIISQGIDSLRIIPKGYGETRLINRCADDVPCPEQEHRANRRTEIYIQGYGKAQRIQQTKGKY